MIKKNCQNMPKYQSGTVLITVILIAAFIIILVVESVKIVRYQKHLSSNLINRDQAYSYLLGMEELAKIWLKKAFDNTKDETVHLEQPWAQDNITFPIDGGVMTASIKDMQSCFNLNTVANFEKQVQNNQGAKPSTITDLTTQETPGQKVLEELINQVKENSDVTGKGLATAVRDWIDKDTDPFGPDGAEDDYYQLLETPYRTGNSLIAHVSELRAMRNFEASIYEKLLPLICVIPSANVEKININTVEEDNAVLLYAIINDKNISLDDVSSALSQRDKKGFESIDDFISAFDGKKIDKKKMSRLDVTSDYFQVTSKAEIGKTSVVLRTLFKKDDKNNFSVVSRYYGR